MLYAPDGSEQMPLKTRPSLNVPIFSGIENIWTRFEMIKRQQKLLFASAVAVVGILWLFSQQDYLRFKDYVAFEFPQFEFPREPLITFPTDSQGILGFTFPTSQDSMALASDKNNKTNPGDKRASTVLSNATTECPRFAMMMPTRNSGLGHRFTEVVLGMKFAQEINATYLYNQGTWSVVGNHGRYDWMAEFIPLQETEVTRNKKEQQQQLHDLQIVQGQWAWMVQNYSEKNSCNIEMRTKLSMCCENRWSGRKKCWCTKDKARIGSFEAMKGRLREAFSKSKYTASKQLPDLLGQNKSNATESHLWIVWHLRVGDIVLNAREEYFSKIATQLAFAIQNSSSMVPLVVFLAEGGETGMTKSFPFLPSICHDLFSDNCFYPKMDVRDSLYHMIHSDILVTSGSSFSAVAGLLRSSGMTLAAIPRDGVVGIFETSEQLLVDRDGTIPEIDALKDYLEQQSGTNRQRLS